MTQEQERHEGSPEPQASPRRLYRSISDRYIAGVCGGVAEYFNLDPTLVRLVWAVSSFIGGVGIIGYLAGWILIPENPQETPAAERPKQSANAGMIIGIILIVLGLALLAEQFRFRYFFPFGFQFPDGGVLISLAVIGLGLYLILRKETQQESPAPEGTEHTEPTARRRLKRSVTDRKIAGVCGGLAKYFNIDSSIVRVACVILAVLEFVVIVTAYIIMAIVVPEEENEEILSGSDSA